MKRKPENAADYSRLKSKIFWQGFVVVALTACIIGILYTLIWKGRGGDWLVSFFQTAFYMDFDDAMYLYQMVFRNNVDVIWAVALLAAFFILFQFFLNGFTRYFNEINRGIDALLDEKCDEIILSPEMATVEKKLNTARQTLEKRTLEAKLAEQRKNDLVMYLAHDIRTPLTSVIGYLSLLHEAPDMPVEQKEKYVRITLEKATRLEKLINEFFEITRYNLQQIKVEKELVDLYYMLVQMIDELYPILTANGNTAVLHADENLKVFGDPVKLARVFNNILKNAAAYSFPNTEIIISAKIQGEVLMITFKNRGKTIPSENLSTLFDRFFRMDEARVSDTGGAGLGLAIAKEIITLHGGTISAHSQDSTFTISISLPLTD